MQRSPVAAAVTWLRILYLALGLSAAGPALAQQPITTPILATDANFRDVAGISASYGGTGHADATSHDGTLRTGVFYRSEALTQLSAADYATLSGLSIRLDVDLRTPSEIAGPPGPPAPNAGPDWVPAGASYVNVNIFTTPGSPPPSGPLNTPAASVAYFESMYRGFVADPGERAALHDALIALADSSGPALFHCSAGKDRTGWTAVLLQSIAGVASATIMNDYLATNAYSATWINTTLAEVTQAAGANEAAILQPQLGVQPSFLQAALDEVATKYGSMNAYLTQGLGSPRRTSTCCARGWCIFRNCPARARWPAMPPPGWRC